MKCFPLDASLSLSGISKVQLFFFPSSQGAKDGRIFTEQNFLQRAAKPACGEGLLYNNFCQLQQLQTVILFSTALPVTDTTTTTDVSVSITASVNGVLQSSLSYRKQSLSAQSAADVDKNFLSSSITVMPAHPFSRNTEISPIETYCLSSGQVDETTQAGFSGHPLLCRLWSSCRFLQV